MVSQIKNILEYLFWNIYFGIFILEYLFWNIYFGKI